MTVLQYLHTFAQEHDDLPAFHAGYLVLTLLAAAMFNFGVFAALILIHMSLDVVKYREHLGFTWLETLEGMIRESLMDITLLFVGLTFSLYFHHSVVAVGMSGVMRTEITLLRAFGTVLPKMKILHNFLKVMSHLRHYLDHEHPSMRRGWSKVDQVCFLLIAITGTLLLFSPYFLGVSNGIVTAILAEEMIPWRL